MLAEEFRTGLGVDVHPFDSTRTLVLGGVVIPDYDGLKGHSDADVVSHCVIDALLGAACLGDIGEHFPDDDPDFKDADSIELLRSIREKVNKIGWRCVNCDLTIICEVPKIAPYKGSIKSRLEDLLSAPVNVKATTMEGLGAIGRGEGIMCWASILISRN